MPVRLGALGSYYSHVSESKLTLRVTRYVLWNSQHHFVALRESFDSFFLRPTLLFRKSQILADVFLGKRGTIAAVGRSCECASCAETGTAASVAALLEMR